MDLLGWTAKGDRELLRVRLDECVIGSVHRTLS